MKKIFTRYLWGVVFLVLLAMLFLNYVQQTRFAQERMRLSFTSKFEQIAQTLKNNETELIHLTASLNEDYLTRARAFAYIIEQNPSVLERAKELERIKTLLNVDELHVINEKGILWTGTVSKYFGMDFRSTKQTAEFLQILENPSRYLVQDIQPNGAEQKVFQYVGVARQDAPGIVQIGLSPRRMLESQSRNELSYILSRIPLEAGESLFAIDPDTHKILTHSNPEYVGKTIWDLGYDENYLEKYKNGGFHAYGGVKSFVLFAQYDNIILGMGCEEGILYADRGRQMLLVFICLLLTSLFMIFCINTLLQRQIVDGVHQIIQYLADITRGNLKRIVQVDDNPEFTQLSASINKMVQSILDENVKVSRIMNMVDVPIGVFEIHNDGSHVMATDRLRQILSWEETEAEYYYQNKELFLEKLNQCREQPEKDEEDIYIITNPSTKWIQIRMYADSQETFGVITDVTAEIREKRRIKRQRDYDALTGLSNLSLFKKNVERLMEKREDSAICALVMLDLDRFKNVNDQYGHEWGDTYLKATAAILHSERENVYAARRSGDEFCLFLYQFPSKAAVLEVLEQLYKDFREKTLVTPDGKRTVISISAGVAWHSEGITDFAMWMRYADAALYDAKNRGRGIFCEFQPENPIQ